MNKLKKLFMPVAMLLLVCVMLTGCGKPNPQNGNGGGVTEDNKLATVQNINYNEGLNKFTWDAVEHADSYNLKINSTEVNDVKTNEYSYVQTVSGTLKIQIQAVDLTGDYKKSDWAEKTFTIEIQENNLKTIIMNYTKNKVRGEFTGFVSAKTHIDDYEDTYLYVIATSKLDGVDILTEFRAPITKGTDLTSLETIIKTNPPRQGRKDYVIAVNTKGQIVNSMQSILYSNMEGTGLKHSYIEQGYHIDVISSYSALDNGDSYGKDFTVHSIVKATRDNEVKYLKLKYDCGGSTSGLVEDNVTTGLKWFDEIDLQELTGDFQEATLSFVNVK